jgi:Protein kinase domain
MFCIAVFLYRSAAYIMYMEEQSVSSARNTMNALSIGTRLSDFEITEIIGEGGFGTVYLAFDHSLQRTVAIKEYMPAALAERNDNQSVKPSSEAHKDPFEAGLKSFINEARLLAQFDHSALIKVYQFWEQNKTAYMAMRYYEGQTLKSVINNEPECINETWLKSMLKPVLDALDVLYSKQILHRDISPDNIMIQKNGDAVLLDFGAARKIIGNMTQAITVILKPGYAPLEQYAEDARMQLGPWTDIYALSAVLYHAIVKAAPPTAVARTISDPILRLQQASYPGFSQEFLAAVDAGLAINPKDRPQSIGEFRALLGIDKLVQFEEIAPLFFSDAAANESAVAPSATPDGVANAVRSAGKAVLPDGSGVQMKKRVAAMTLAAALCVLGVFGLMRKTDQEPHATGAANAAHAAASQTQAMASPPATSAQVAASTPAAISQTTAAAQPVAPAPAMPSLAHVSADEAAAWEALKRSTQPEAITEIPDAMKAISAAKIFIHDYPAGQHVEEAQVRLSDLQDIVKLKTAQASAAAATAADTGSKVALSILPWGKIVVDGKQRGLTPPLKSLSLREGKHLIRIANASFSDYVTVIDVVKGKPITIAHDFSKDAAHTAKSSIKPNRADAMYN